MRRLTLTLLVLGSVASVVHADITGQFQSVTSEGGGPPPAGFVTQDLLVDASTDWLGANLIINLASGTIHQDPLLVGIGPPSPALLAAIPSLRWDTFLTGSGGIAAGAPSSAGGAVDIGGQPSGTFDSSHIDINWFTVETNDIGVFTLGRFTLSDDATGSFILRLDALPDSAARVGPFILEGTIQNGQLVAIPEASSLVFAGLAAVGLGIAGTRRRRTAE